MSHAVWSGGDYNESEITNLSKTNVTAVVSDDYSHIGNKSIKITQTSNGSTHLLRITEYELPNESLIGKTALLTLHTFTPNDALKFSLHFYNSNNEKISTESVYSTATSTEQSITVSKIIPENTVKIRITSDVYSVYSSYIDDIIFGIN